MDLIPSDLRRLRACLGCSVIKSFEQFERDGCINCDKFLRMKSNYDNVQEFTSKNFSGMVGVMEPSQSWVCKWLRVDTCHPGMYAISVSGNLPREIVREMRRLGITTVTRDRSERN